MKKTSLEINKLRSKIFSKNSLSEYGWDRLIKINLEVEHNLFFSFHSMHEMLYFYQYEVARIEKSKNSLSDIVFLSNAFVDIYTKVFDLLDAIGADEARKAFINKLNQIDFSIHHTCSSEEIALFSYLRRNLNGNDVSVDNGQKFLDFVISVRNFFIHKNSSGYNLVFFSSSDDFDALENKYLFKDRKNGLNFFVKMSLFYEMINLICDVIIDCKKLIINSYKKINKSKERGIKAIKIFKKEEVVEIFECWINLKHKCDFVKRELLNSYEIYNLVSVWNYSKNFSDEKLINSIFNIAIISSIHKYKEYYDQDFFDYLPSFQINDMLDAFNETMEDRTFYAYEQLEEYPEIFVKLDYQLINDELKKNPEQNLLEFVNAKIYSNQISMRNNFFDVIEKYKYYCYDDNKNNGNLSFNHFMKNIYKK